MDTLSQRLHPSYQQAVWDAMLLGNIPLMEQRLWEVVKAESSATQPAFRRAVLMALDGSRVAPPEQAQGMLQRYLEVAVMDNTDAQLLLGAFLAFHYLGREPATMAMEGFKFLHSAALKGARLALVCLGLAAEAGAGCDASTDLARQCYSLAAQQGDHLAAVLFKEFLGDRAVIAGRAIPPPLVTCPGTPLPCIWNEVLPALTMHCTCILDTCVFLALGVWRAAAVAVVVEGQTKDIIISQCAWLEAVALIVSSS